MFSVADEVFALIMLYNEYDVWEDQNKREGNINKTKEKKKFLDSKNGRRKE